MHADVESCLREVSVYQPVLNFYRSSLVCILVFDMDIGLETVNVKQWEGIFKISEI